MEVNLIVSDPWEFGTEHGTGPFTGRIVHVGSSASGDVAVLLRLDDPLSFKGESLQCFIATPRLEEDKLENLADGAQVNVNLTRITEDQASSTLPLDLTAWRGGLILIGTLERI